ncbi:MAG: YkvA family protein [Candidatus Coproplasma sp.]
MSEAVLSSKEQERISKRLKRKEKLAKILIASEKKMDEFLLKLEEELKTLPQGEALAYIPVFVSMVKSYFKKEYTAFPMNTLVSIVALLIYWFSPLDVIPDKIPVIGKADDICAIGIVLRGVGKDVDEYKSWKNGEINKPLFNT